MQPVIPAVNDVAEKLALPARWLLVAGIAYTLATSALYFVSPPATAPVQGAVSRKPAARAAPDLNAILASNLFGAADQTVDQPANEPAVVTQLPLDLLAVYVADNPEESVATIAERGREGINYHIGDKVPGNATLVEVHDGYVVLRRAGTRETLNFPQPGENLVARTPTASGGGVDQSFPDVMQENSGSAGDASDGAGEPGVSMQDPNLRDLVNEYKQQLQQNPSHALDELGVQPVQAGAADGYRIGELARSPYLRQTGLQPGDVILSVNGRPVGDLKSDRLELDNVLAQGSARLEVQRGNRRFFVTASIK